MHTQRRLGSGWVTPAVAAALSLGIAISSNAQSPAPATQVISAVAGSQTFRTYCAVCHGTSAKGDGPLADSMKRRPADLTEIAKRNGGTFAADQVFRMIDGRQAVRGHGRPDMPVWGDAFSRSAEVKSEEAVRAKIQSLVSYLESIQARTTY